MFSLTTGYQQVEAVMKGTDVSPIHEATLDLWNQSASLGHWSVLTEAAGPTTCQRALFVSFMIRSYLEI